jgi:hypothetical protein
LVENYSLQVYVANTKVAVIISPKRTIETIKYQFLKEENFKNIAKSFLEIQKRPTT